MMPLHMGPLALISCEGSLFEAGAELIGLEGAAMSA
jgi:hypothetical protein